MSRYSEKSSLLEFAVKKLKNENIQLQDQMNSISINEIEKNKKILNLQSAALEAAANGIVITDAEGHINWVNEAFTRLTGYSKEEVYLKNPRILKSSLQDESYYKNLWNTISAGNVWKGELLNKRKDGSFYTEDMTITPVKNKKDVITNYIAIKQDISKEKAVREIENLTRTTTNLNELLSEIHSNINKVFPAPNFYVAMLEESTGIVSFPYFKDQFAQKPQPREKTKSLIDYVINNHKPLLLTPKVFNNLLQQEKIEAIDTIPKSLIGVPLIIGDKSTGVLVIQSYDENLEYNDSHLDWLVSISNLISNAIERRDVELNIQQNEIKFKAIINSSNDAIVTIDEERKIILWNNAAVNLFGYMEEEVLYKNIFSVIIPEKLLSETEKRFNTTFSIGNNFKGKFNFIAKKKDNTEFESEISISLTEFNNSRNITAICRDISNKNNLEKSSEKEKEEIIEALKNELSHVKNNYAIMSSIIETLPQHIYVKDKQCRFTLVNKAMTNFMGFKSGDEIIGKSDSDFFEEPIARSFFDEEKKIMQTGDAVINKEHIEVKQDGSTTWGQTSKFPLYNFDHEVIGTFGITADLTERKKVEIELKENHYKFRKLIENSTLGIIRLDSIGEIIMVNPAFVKMLGYYSEAEILSFMSDKIYHSNSNRKKFFQILKKEEKISGFEDVLIKNGNILVDVRESGWAIKDKNNQVIYYEVIVEDITEQNQVLNILHESEFKYRTLLDKLNEAVFLKIGEKFEVVNTKFLELLEITEEEVYDDNFDIKNFLTESKNFVSESEQVINSNDLHSNVFQLNLITKSGSEKEVEISISFLNFNGNLAEQGIIRDLTNFKKQETQIRHLQKMEAIGTLAAGIAHEINTPSQFVNDNLTFMKDAYKDIQPIFQILSETESKEECITKLDKISKNIDLEYLQNEIPSAIDQSLDGIKRIAKIVGAMRDFAHTSPKDKVSADLHKIIQNSITLSKNAWKYIAEIETEFDETITSIVCQPNDLNQVIINMIVNSCHAMEDKFAGSETLQGKIKIKTLKQDDKVEIYLSDNGKGMSNKVMKRIYDPFYTTKEVGKGTGQGLAIAHDIIVAKHNGNIEVESEEGKGTTFKIFLPIDSNTENGPD